jgi:hypothetical protein
VSGGQARWISRAALPASALVLCAGLFVLAADRDAGWPSQSADLQGRWVLQEVSGPIVSPPPAELTFTAGSSAGSVRMSDGREAAEFEIDGLGRFVFGNRPDFGPLLAADASETWTMTGRCRALPAWDRLTFFPDGAPTGNDASRRLIRYERE